MSLHIHGSKIWPSTITHNITEGGIGIKGKRDTVKTYFRLIALFVAILSLVGCVSIWKDIYYQPVLVQENMPRWTLSEANNKWAHFNIGACQISMSALIESLSRGFGLVVPLPIVSKDKSASYHIALDVWIYNTSSQVELDLSKFLLLSPTRKAPLAPVGIVLFTKNGKYHKAGAMQRLPPVAVHSQPYQFSLEYDIKVPETDTFYLECPVISIGGVKYDMGKIYFKKKSKTDWDITGFGA